jgi:hypothetical protein
LLDLMVRGGGRAVKHQYGENSTRVSNVFMQAQQGMALACGCCLFLTGVMLGEE